MNAPEPYEECLMASIEDLLPRSPAMWRCPTCGTGLDVIDYNPKVVFLWCPECEVHFDEIRQDGQFTPVDPAGVAKAIALDAFKSMERVAREHVEEDMSRPENQYAGGRY